MHSRMSNGGPHNLSNSKKDLLFSATATSANSAFGSVIGSPYSTPFILVEERDNKWKIDQRLKDTLDSREAIPFLRTNDPEYKEIIYKKNNSKFRSNTIHDLSSPMSGNSPSNGAASGYATSPFKMSPSKKPPTGGDVNNMKHRLSNFLKRREQNWQQYVLPISKLNEQWHPTYKITFEKI